MEFVIGIAIIILSIIFHEVAHGYMADWLGDPTARYSGRLTLNPIPHIDMVGSVIVPGILALTNSPFLIGWAKPVPYNPYNLRNQRWGEALVGIAGPLTNIVIAVAFGLVIRFAGPQLSEAFLSICVTVVYTNIVLAIFNMIPLPPLDGSKVLAALLPYPLSHSYRQLESFTYALGPFGLLAVGFLAIYLLWPVLSVVVRFLFLAITGA